MLKSLVLSLLAVLLPGCAQLGALTGRGLPSPSSPSARASDLAEPDAPRGAGSPAAALAAGGGELVGMLPAGNLVYLEGKLYLTAYANGADRGAAPPSLRIKKGSAVLGEVQLAPSRSHPNLFVFNAIDVERTSATNTAVFEDKGLSLALSVGKYSAELVRGEQTLAARAFSIVELRTVGGKKALEVDPRDREGSAFLDVSHLQYWARVDARGASNLQFVWMRGDGVANRARADLAGFAVYQPQSRLLDVVPVPDVVYDDWNEDRAALRLFVFREGKLEGIYRVSQFMDNGYGHKLFGMLEKAAPASAGQGKLAAATAAEEASRAGSGRQWSEAVVCAAATNPAAFEAVGTVFSSSNATAWSSEDSRQSTARSENPFATAEERRKHRESAKAQGEGASLARREVAAANQKLSVLSKPFKPGCLERLAVARLP